MSEIRDFADRREAAGVSVLLLGGLPGSGKSPYSEEFERRGWLRFDDFQRNAPGDSDQFRRTARFSELVDAVASGRRCVVTDIRFIYAEYRDGAIRALREVPGSHPVELHLFENDPEQCAKNVGKATDRDTARRLENINFWTTKYSRPYGMIPIPVLRPQT
jgi:AAA domain-containing protein